ncbi:hypothetical protein GOBAR_DD34733 [Gossypium barbadense]|nr:hypothetical protein GOBAR_DD34733 [Gossypium barbadense]
MDPFFSSMPVAPPPPIPPPSVIPVVPPFVSNPTTATTVAGAIGALKDKNGSSKRAIAKYIESAHKDLPPTHSALLTHHLKRLKNNGILVMVKKSYKLASTARSEGRGRPPKTGPKKSPGRPRKPKTVRPRGRPKGTSVAPAGLAVPGKGRGRPPKSSGVAAKPIKPKKSTGKPVGRPKKTTDGAASYGDLKRKLEFFQSKVKQAVGVLKSQFSSESNISAIDAIQELEWDKIF